MQIGEASQTSSDHAPGKENAGEVWKAKGKKQKKREDKLRENDDRPRGEVMAEKAEVTQEKENQPKPREPLKNILDKLK